MNSALGVSRFLYALVAIICIASTGCVSCTQPCLPSAGPSVGCAGGGCGGGCGMLSSAGSRLRGRAHSMLGHLGGGGSGCGCGGGEVISMGCGNGGCGGGFGGGANMCGSGGLLGNLGCGTGITGGLIGGGCGGGCGAGIGNEMAAKFGQMCEGGHCNRPYPPGMGAGGMPGAMTQYPYYTLRGPRDFLMANPPSIGP